MRNYSFTDTSLRNSEVVQAMGMVSGLLERWGHDRNRVIEHQTVASDRAAATSSTIWFFRLAMQSLILALGAYLVIDRLATIGAMFAASILLGRALQPVEQLVGSWRSLISAREAFVRVKELLAANPPPDPTLNLPRPQGHLLVEGLTYALPKTNKPVLRVSIFAWHRGGVGRDRCVGCGQINVGAADRWRPFARHGAPCALTAPTFRLGRGNRWDAILVICRKTLNCSPTPSPPTSVGSAVMPTTTRS